MAVTGLRLYGVASVQRADGRPLADDTVLVAVRELGAVCRVAPYVAPELGELELVEHQRVVDEVFRSHTVIPVSPGTVFRSEEHVRRWLEMNYVALVEGVHFVDGRCEVRVHVREHRDGDRQDDPSEGRISRELSGLAGDALRALRRSALAALPLRRHDGAEPVMSSAFLIDRGDLNDFAQLVSDQARRLPSLDFERTGPWPPYDFVRVDFGV